MPIRFPRVLCFLWSLWGRQSSGGTVGFFREQVALGSNQKFQAEIGLVTAGVTKVTDASVTLVLIYRLAISSSSADLSSGSVGILSFLSRSEDGYQIKS